MKNMKKKGFTLVELLVVIAIIAILATVSVVGYTAFLTKANESNAITELSQIKDAVQAAVLDGEESVKIDDTTTVTFTYANNTLTAKVNGVVANADNADEVKAAMLKLTEMDSDTALVATVDATTGEVSSVEYTYGDATVTWDVETGKVE